MTADQGDQTTGVVADAKTQMAQALGWLRS